MFLRPPEMMEYVEDLADAPVEYQYHTNHRDCPAGADSKRRLYVKRAPDGWMFYCHHCNHKGYLRVKDYVYRADELTRPEKVTLSNTFVNELSVGTWLKRGWSAEARLWWASYGLTELDATQHNVQFANDRLCISWFGTWSCRGFNAAPKWLMYPSAFTMYHSAGDDLKQVVLVEDVLSAIKIKNAGYSVMPLFGTAINTQHKAICAQHDSVIVWLDDDVAGQKATATAIKEISFNPVLTVRYKQPKECSYAEIKEYLGA